MRIHKRASIITAVIAVSVLGGSVGARADIVDLSNDSTGLYTYLLNNGFSTTTSPSGSLDSSQCTNGCINLGSITSSVTFNFDGFKFVSGGSNTLLLVNEGSGVFAFEQEDKSNLGNYGAGLTISRTDSGSFTLNSVAMADIYGEHGNSFIEISNLTSTTNGSCFGTGGNPNENFASRCLADTGITALAIPNTLTTETAGSSLQNITAFNFSLFSYDQGTYGSPVGGATSGDRPALSAINFTLPSSTIVPEPASMTMFSAGLVAFGWLRRRKKA